MKKLLLLLSFIIALSPTISAADITLKFFSSGSTDNENAITDSSAGRLTYQTVSTNGFGFTDFSNSTSNISIRELRRPSAGGNDYISIVANPIGASSETFKYINHVQQLESGNGSLTFKMMFGKIKSVKITFGATLTNGSQPFEPRSNCTRTVSGADYTYTATDPSKPIVLAYNLTNTAIKEITVTYEEATDFKPSAPTVTFSETAARDFGYELDEAKKRITLTVLPNQATQSMISCVVPDNADQVYYTFQSQSALNVPSKINVANSDNTGDSFTVLNSSGYSVNYWMSGYYSVNFGSSLPASDTRGAENMPLNDASKNPLKLRVFAYNSAAKTFSDVVTYEVKINRISAPVVDAATTSAVEGQRYDAATNTLYYTKVNPQVYFKIDEHASATYYSTNYSDNPLDTKTSYTSGNPITINNWIEGIPTPPVGTFNQIKIISQVTFLGRTYYDENKGEATTINIIREAAAIPGQWRLTGYTPYQENYRPVTGSAPSVITFNGAIQLQFDPQGDDYYSKIYDHNPTASELGTFAESAVLIDKTKNMVENIYVIGKDDFPANTPEIWLACAGKNDAGMGEPYVIRLALKGPDAPKFVVDGGGYPGQPASTNDYTVAGGSLKSHFETTDETTVVEYIMVPQSGNSWPTQPVGSWTRLTVTNGRVEFPGDRVNTGRLFFRAGKPMTTGSSKYIYSDYEYTDFTRLQTANASLSQKTSWYGPFSDNSLITINEDVRLVGIYSANGVNDVTKYLYMIAKNGSVIKVTGTENYRGGWSSGFTEMMTQENRNKSWVLKAGTFYAFIRYPYGNTLPQLSLNSDTESMIPLLSSPVEDDSWKLNDEGRRMQLPENRTTINREVDLDRYVELRALTWRGNGIFEMTNGEQIRLYDQFKEFTINVNNLIVGQEYYVRGIIGLVGADLAIFPVADILRCPATPTLYSPNPIAGDADAQGYITANVISDNVIIRAEGSAGENSTFKYRIDGGELQDVSGNNIVINLDNYSFAVTTGLRLEVFSVLNGLMCMEPAKVKLYKKIARDVESIHAYKEGIFDATLDNSANSVYRMTGNAIIEEMTDRFLYVRDYDDAHMGEGKEEYIHRLLIRNTDGWNAEIIDPATNETRPLKEGDVITGFAIVPLEINGNLLGESTGYASTFNFVRHIEGYNFDPEVRNIDYTESSDGNGTAFKFTEKDQMCLITLAGVTVSRADNPDPDAADRYVYTLDIAGDYPTQMNFNIFTFRGGFTEAYLENTKYNITGVVLIDGNNGFSFAPIEFTAAAGKIALPDVYLSTIAAANRDDLEQPFVSGSIIMNAKTKTIDGIDVEGDVKIYYSIDGLDPLNNISSRIEYTDEIPLSDNTVEIRAFASAPGYTPSDVVVRRFVKNSRDVQFILNFLQWTEPGGTYRFTGRTRVAGIGGQYLFLYDILGNYLPVFRTDGWDNRGINKGDMMTGFTMGHKIDENVNHLAVADGFVETFIPTAATAQDNVDYLPVPTDASELNINVHPGRMVRLMNVTVRAPQTKTDGAGTTLNPEIWTITESNDNATHPMMVGKLGKVTIHERDANGVEVGEPTNDFVDGDNYHIIGYVMLGTPGRDVQMEMWPVQATHLEMTAPVEVSFDSGTTVADEPNEFGEIEASFQGMTLVRLSCPTRGATIMYAFGENSDNLTWYQYQHPFAVTSSTYMHAKAVNGLNVESEHTHVVFTAMQPSGDIAFSATAADGKTTLTITPQGEVAEGTEIWYSIGNDRTCSRLYRTPLTFTESTTVYACLKEPGKARGNVSTIRVMVIPASAGTARVSGRVRFITSTDEETGAIYLNILPEDASVVDYDIYYTTDANVSLTPLTGTLFTEAIEVTEATYFLAILVEHGKEAGVVCGMNVWINPSGIDEITADSAAAAGIDVDGNNILAPAGSKVFTINGGRVCARSLRPGVYIVVLPDGRAAKVAIL